LAHTLKIEGIEVILAERISVFPAVRRNQDQGGVIDSYILQREGAV
jgi:hypothetical protein